jgi:hypothetical protein
MTGQVEFSSRAALCRQLAKSEPANGVLWMAEAANWLRLSNEKRLGDTRTPISSGVLASWHMRSLERLLNSCVSKRSRLGTD